LSVSPYHDLPFGELQRQYSDLRENINYFLRYVQGYPSTLKIEVCDLDLLDIISRVDKRVHYFEVFHPRMPYINECKRAALVAYWFLKFRPVKITDPGFINQKEGYNSSVNEYFAIHYLLSELNAAERIKHWDGTDGVDFDFSHPYVRKLAYSFRYRNFTIDSMIVMADSITTETFKLPQTVI
jgi:hypothetical protein